MMCADSGGGSHLNHNKVEKEGKKQASLFCSFPVRIKSQKLY